MCEVMCVYVCVCVLHLPTTVDCVCARVLHTQSHPDRLGGGSSGPMFMCVSAACVQEVLWPAYPVTFHFTTWQRICVHHSFGA